MPEPTMQELLEDLNNAVLTALHAKNGQITEMNARIQELLLAAQEQRIRNLLATLGEVATAARRLADDMTQAGSPVFFVDRLRAIFTTDPPAEVPVDGVVPPCGGLPEGPPGGQHE